MKNKTIWIGVLILLIGFLMLFFTFNVVYNSYYYQNLSLPFIHIIGEVLIIYGLYLSIKWKIKINEFFKPTKWKVILSVIIFIVLSKILLDLWAYLSLEVVTCSAIGCGPIFGASRALARFAPLILILSYLLSALILYSVNKIRTYKK